MNNAPDCRPLAGSSGVGHGTQAPARLQVAAILRNAPNCCTASCIHLFKDVSGRCAARRPMLCAASSRHRLSPTGTGSRMAPVRCCSPRGPACRTRSPCCRDRDNRAFRSPARRTNGPRPNLALLRLHTQPVPGANPSHNRCHASPCITALPPENWRRAGHTPAHIARCAAHDRVQPGP